MNDEEKMVSHMSPMISVVMPTYNSEKYISESVRSILTQSFGDFEFIIVNELGSDDGTIPIIESFHDPRVKIIQNTKHLGIAESLNEGIRQARGKYIARMDSDDISLSHRFATQVNFMESNQEITVLSAWERRFGNSHITSRTAATHDEIKARMLFYCELSHFLAVLRKNDILKHNLWYDVTNTAEDYALWCRAVHKVRFANIQEVLGLRRIYGESATDLRSEKVERNLQNIYSDSLALLDMDYCEYTPFFRMKPILYSVPTEKKREKLEGIRHLFYDIIEKNKKIKIYDHDCLYTSLNRIWLWNHYSDNFSDVNAYEYLIEDIMEVAKKLAGGRDICLFGMGKVGNALLPYFKESFGIRLICVSDNDPNKWGEEMEGIKCVSPWGLSEDICIFLTAAFETMEEIMSQLKLLGMKFVYPYSKL
jgi:glycosyltransferase involved in cell wall biosynthesis